MIELPRSLLDVVTAWNLPIHQWLKKYVFKPTQKSAGVKQALFLTYFVSNMIHGFEANIFLILLSLGFYTYVEFEVRKTLSELLSCCAEAKKCKTYCRHKFKSNFVITKILNGMFTLLNMYHLAYLGQLFYQNNDEDKNWFRVAFEIWSRTYFLSPLINFTFLFIYLFVKDHYKTKSKSFAE